MIQDANELKHQVEQCGGVWQVNPYRSSMNQKMCTRTFENNLFLPPTVPFDNTELEFYLQHGSSKCTSRHYYFRFHDMLATDCLYESSGFQEFSPPPSSSLQQQPQPQQPQQHSSMQQR